MKRVKDWIVAVPKISWFLLFIAIVAGGWTHMQNPYGIFLYTPRDLCLEQRSHAFFIGFCSVISVGLVVCGVALLVGLAASATRTSSSEGMLLRAIVPLIASILMLLLAIPIGILSGELLPLKIDPMCYQIH